MFKRTGIAAVTVLLLFMTTGCINIRRQASLIEPTYAYTRDAAPAEPVSVASVSTAEDRN